jgi:hypothetical protein
MSKPHSAKGELAIAVAGTSAGLTIGAAGIAFAAFFYNWTGLDLLGAKVLGRHEQGIILLLPLLAIALVVVALKRYPRGSAVPGILVYVGFAAMSLLCVSWSGVAYVELLMSSPRRDLDTPGFLLGYLATGVFFLVILVRRLRAVSTKGNLD